MRYLPMPDFKKETISYLMACEGLTEQEAIDSVSDQAVYRELHARVMQRICSTTGHKIVDKSYGNPEHGCVDMSCIRCGWHFHHALY